MIASPALPHRRTPCSRQAPRRTALFGTHVGLFSRCLGFGAHAIEGLYGVGGIRATLFPHRIREDPCRKGTGSFSRSKPWPPPLISCPVSDSARSLIAKGSAAELATVRRCGRCCRTAIRARNRCFGRRRRCDFLTCALAVLKKGCYYPFAQVAVRTVLDAGFGIERLCSRKRADNEVDAARVRRNRRPAPLFDFDGSAVHLEAHIVEIRVVDVNGYIEIVGVGESRRIVAYGLVCSRRNASPRRCPRRYRKCIP